MRDKERINLFLEKVEKIWKEHFPDWRFMQLINNLQHYADNDMFYLEEDSFLDVLENFVKNIIGEKEEE